MKVNKIHLQQRVVQKMVQYHYPNLNRIRVIYEFSKKEAAQKINNLLNNNSGFIGIVEVKVRK